jgi:predicted negative regulator of RcsB-dependent stress response
VQSYTRRQLKQDKFVATTHEAVHWTVEHRNTLIGAAIVLGVALAILLGWNVYQNNQEEKASAALGQAIRTYTSAIRPAGEAVQPDAPFKTFASLKERSDESFKEFQQIAEKYPHTKNGDYARFLAGVSAMDKGDNSGAEQQFKKAADGDKDTAALAKFTLAGLYRSEGKTEDAAKLYREVIDADRVTVAKSQAQLELAQMYEQKNPTEAVKVYEQIIKDEQAKAKEEEKAQAKGKTPTPPGPEATQKSPLQQMAEAKIAQLKAAANKK